MDDDTARPEGEEQIEPGEAPDDLDEPTGLLLVDLGRPGRLPLRAYAFDLTGFLLAWLFVLVILAGTMLLARLGA